MLQCSKQDHEVVQLMDYDTLDLWEEIRDMPGEIFDIPEMLENDQLDFEKSLCSEEDF